MTDGRIGGAIGDLPNAGDLAICVQVCGCPGSLHNLGRIVRASEVVPLFMFADCGYCHQWSDADEALAFDDGTYGNRAFYRRIPPLAELQSIHIADELELERGRRHEVVA